MNQSDQENPKTICQLCNQSVLLYDSLAGSFERICKKCYGYQLDEMFQPIHYIGEGIYLGNEDAHRNEKILKQYGIGAILTCAGQLKPHQYEDLVVQRRGINIKDIQGQNIGIHFDGALQWVQKMIKEGKKVFIHCAAGVSRSGSFTIAYFMKTKNMSYREAFLFVKSQRRCVKPNQGFQIQLAAFQEKLKSSTQ